MRPTRNSAGDMITDKEGNPTEWEVLPFDEDDSYNMSYYSGTNDQWENIHVSRHWKLDYEGLPSIC